MPRQPRADAPGAVHHVWTRGLERRVIFIDELDRLDLLQRLIRVLPEGGARCPAWAFVSNHVHYVIQTGEVPLGALLARIHTGFAVRFNRRHERSGYLFQNRFGSRLITSAADLMYLVRYVHLNPVRAGLVPLARLASYPWSGHGALLGARGAHPFESVQDVLGLFGSDPPEARRRLSEWMAAADEVGPVSAATPGTRRDLGALIRTVCERAGVSEVELREGERAHQVARARAIVCYLAVGELGMPGRAVARALGITPGAVSQAVRRGALFARTDGHVG